MATEQQILATKQIFMSMDQDKDGKLNRREIRIMFRKLGEPLTRAELEVAIHEMDNNNSGYVEWEEFKKYMF